MKVVKLIKLLVVNTILQSRKIPLEYTLKIANLKANMKFRDLNNCGGSEAEWPCQHACFTNHTLSFEKDKFYGKYDFHKKVSYIVLKFNDII